MDRMRSGPAPPGDSLMEPEDTPAFGHITASLAGTQEQLASISSFYYDEVTDDTTEAKRNPTQSVNDKTCAEDTSSDDPFAFGRPEKPRVQQETKPNGSAFFSQLLKLNKLTSTDQGLQQLKEERDKQDQEREEVGESLLDLIRRQAQGKEVGMQAKGATTIAQIDNGMEGQQSDKIETDRSEMGDKGNEAQRKAGYTGDTGDTRDTKDTEPETETETEGEQAQHKLMLPEHRMNERGGEEMSPNRDSISNDDDTPTPERLYRMMSGGVQMQTPSVQKSPNRQQTPQTPRRQQGAMEDPISSTESEVEQSRNPYLKLLAHSAKTHREETEQSTSMIPGSPIAVLQTPKRSFDQSRFIERLKASPAVHPELLEKANIEARKQRAEKLLSGKPTGPLHHMLGETRLQMRPDNEDGCQGLQAMGTVLSEIQVVVLTSYSFTTARLVTGHLYEDTRSVVVCWLPIGPVHVGAVSVSRGTVVHLRPPALHLSGDNIRALLSSLSDLSVHNYIESLGVTGLEDLGDTAECKTNRIRLVYICSGGNYSVEHPASSGSGLR